jgi:hypothetical protein
MSLGIVADGRHGGATIEVAAGFEPDRPPWGLEALRGAKALGGDSLCAEYRWRSGGWPRGGGV